MNDIPAILGGSPVRTSSFAPRVTMGHEERQAVLEVIDSDVLSAFIGGPGRSFAGGPKVQRFEADWATAFRVRHAVSVNSWTTGLVTAVGAVGVQPGDEVICSPYTMSASATCALFYGGVPVFADIDPDTFCLDPDSIEASITPRTKAIVAVHLFGQPADMNEILELAKPRGIRVIEDGAQSPGAMYGGRCVGALGDIGGFSLNYHKHIHTGEGGMIVTNDDELAHRCRLIRNHGENANEDLDDDQLPNTIGSNYRLTELQAAVGIAQLKRLSGCLTVRQQLAEHLTQCLADIPGVHPQRCKPDRTHAYYVFPIKYDASQLGISREMFVKSVVAEFPGCTGVESTPLFAGYVKPLYWNRLYQQQIAIGKQRFPFSCNPDVRYEYPRGLCPVAEQAYQESLLLSPLVREPLTIADMEELAAAIRKVARHADAIREHFGEVAVTSQSVYTPLQAAMNERPQ